MAKSEAQALLRQSGHAGHDLIQPSEAVQIAADDLQHRRLAHLAQAPLERLLVGNEAVLQQEPDASAITGRCQQGGIEQHWWACQQPAGEVAELGSAFEPRGGVDRAVGCRLFDLGWMHGRQRR